MPPTEMGPLVACVNSSEDLVQLLAEYLELEGFRAVAHATPIRWGAGPVIDFVSDLRPDACVYSVGPPYEASWREFEALRAAVPDVPCVLVTTNLRALRSLVGPVDGIEVIGMPFDLDEVCRAVRRALDRRSSAAA